MTLLPKLSGEHESVFVSHVVSKLSCGEMYLVTMIDLEQEPNSSCVSLNFSKWNIVGVQLYNYPVLGFENKVRTGGRC
jgi:hypothetical protein